VLEGGPVIPGELPLERTGDLLEPMLEGEQALGNLDE
jgi:hypothetical protein